MCCVVGLVPKGQRGAAQEDSGSQTGLSPEMKQFFSDIELVKQNIVVIKNATERIMHINQQMILATTSEREQDISGDLNPIIVATNKKANITKGALQKLREDTERLKTSSASKQSEVRIRENLGNTLTRKFVDVMKEYQNAQTKYKTDIKKKVKRQVQIVKPDATSEEIDAVLRAGGSGEVFKQAILKGPASDAVMNAYKNVQDKYQDILALEASVAELHQMFLDFALLTEQQGELLDQISYQVQAAGDYIEEGNKEMVQAINYQISLRKKQICCCCVILAILAIIISVAVVYTRNKKSSSESSSTST